MWLFFVPLIVLCYVLTQTFMRKEKNLPPSLSLPALPIIGHLYLMIKRPLHRNLAKLSNRYGPLLYLKFGTRRVLLVSSASLAEECLNKNDVTFANRPSQLFVGKYIGNNYTTMGWAPYGDHWRNLRKITSLELLSAYRVEMMSDIRGDEVRRMIGKLNNSGAGTTDMRSLFFQLTMNVIMRMIAGKRYYGDDTVEDEEKTREFRYLVEATFKSIAGTYITDYLPIFKLFDNTSKWMGTLQKRRDKFIRNLIDEKRASIKNSGSNTNGDQKKKTMLEVVLSLQQNEPDYYNDDLILGILMNTLAAAVDTSVLTMEWAMTFMVNNPEVIKKAQKEIDNVVGYDRLIEDSDLAKLPYLHCVISETLRMCLPGPFLLPHYSSQECTVGGYRVPSNTMLLINAWAIQNDPQHWEEPEKFKPERFEATNVAELGMRYLPFGSGRRRCPGEGLAKRVVGLTLGSLIQCFDWERVGSMDMTEGSGLMITKVVPLQAKYLPRPAMAKLLSQI